MKTFLIVLTLVISNRCLTQTTTETPTKKYKDEILKTDIAFNDAFQQEGMAKAFIGFAAEDVILMRQTQNPIIGIKALVEHFNKIKSKQRLSWIPMKAEVSTAGDLGYTFGNWKSIGKTLEGKDTTSYGVYVTIWKKQVDGKWKYVLDGGNSTPQLFKDLTK